jgi:5'-nucleotidase
VVEFNAASGEITRIDPDSGPVRVAGGANPDAVVPDPQVQTRVIAPVQAYVDRLDTRVIARSEVALNGLRKQVRSKETNAGNLVADSLLSEARRLCGKFGVKAPAAALANGGSIRNNTIIAAGQITERDTYDVVPFPNFLAVIENVSVATFKNLLENAVSRIDKAGKPAGSGTGRFAQIAGFSFEYDPTRPAIEIDSAGRIVTPGARVTRVVLDNETKLIDDGIIVVDSTYTLAVASIDFLARGGDQYPFRNLPYTNFYITYQEALNNYIRQTLGGVITAVDYPEGGNNRIVRRPDKNGS